MASTTGFLFLTVLQISGFKHFLFDKKRQSDAATDRSDYMNWVLENQEELFWDKDFCPYLTPYDCQTKKYRSLDGKCNNLWHPIWGSSSTPYLRFMPSVYEDGIATPRTTATNGKPLINPTFIRHFIFSSNTNESLTRNINEFKVYFGQFVSHDIAKTAGTLFEEIDADTLCCNNNTDPCCIPMFNPERYKMGELPSCYSFLRSKPTHPLDCAFGPREQRNEQTSYLDLSNIYGTSEYGLDYLRLKKKGLMRMVKCGDDILLSPDWNDITGCRNKEYPCMLAGDLRLNQHAILTYIHVIWTLEHNRVAEILYNLNPQWTDERLFQEASKFVRAEYQHIVYNDLLPIIIGNTAMNQYGLYSRKSGYHFGYDRNINAGIRNGFATAAYRYAHSMVDDVVTFSGGCPYASKKCNTEDFVDMQEQIFRPSLRHGCTMTVYKNLSEVTTSNLYKHLTGGTEMMRGILMKRAQLNNDLRFSDDLSTRMFSGQIELFSFDIQRGRDHGLPGYNMWRRFCNLSTAKTFQHTLGGLVDHPIDIANKLSRVYSSPDDIDVLLGGLTEVSPPGQGLVGPLFKCMIGLQFKFLKDGDRFWYENPGKEGFTLAQLTEIRKATHARVLLDNTHLEKVPKQSFLIFDMFMNKMVNKETCPKINFKSWNE